MQSLALPSASLLALCLVSFAHPTLAETPTSSAAVPSYGNLALTFEANQGQAPRSAQYLSHGQGYSLLLSPGQITLALAPTHGQTKDSASPSPAAPSILRMDLVHANTGASATAEEPLSMRTNYFLGSDPTRWHTDIPNYGRVRYHSIYPGIDLVYYGNHRQLEHDFLVAPNADPAQIVFTLDAHENAQIDPATGDLVLLSGARQLRLLKPVSYQESNGRRAPVVSGYRLLAGNRIGFTLGAYDRGQPLVIDPVLTYATFLGGGGSPNGGDVGNSIAVDASGSAYIAGSTYSTDFPITSSAVQTGNSGAGATPVAFISKLSPDGSALVYSTYLGGTGGDQAFGIALDAGGSAYITGITASTDFPITCGAYQTVFPSKTAAPVAFVARLSATGNALVYSTYLGRSGNQTSTTQGDIAQAIAVDLSGNAYIAGYTWSPDFPTTEKAFQTTFTGSATLPNGFVSKLDPSGTTLAYSTYLGGSGSAAGGDVANSIAVDPIGNAYIAGTTGSSDFPVTKGAFQGSNNGGSSATNGFVTELNPTGTAEVFSTYLGGSGGDSAVALALDKSGYIFVAGNTYSADFPVTSGVLEGSSYGDNAAYLTTFVTRIAPGGGSLAYSTHLEGRLATISSMAVDSSGNAYLVGQAGTPILNQFAGFVTTPDALATPPSQNLSAFLVKLNSSATAINYATLLGGSGNDNALGVAVDGSGNAYLTGNVSYDFPTTAGVFEPGPDAPTRDRSPVTVTALSTQLTCSDYAASLTISGQITSDTSKPSPSGQATLFSSYFQNGANATVTPGSGGTSSVTLTLSVNGFSPISTGDSIDWSLTYDGDSIHAAGAAAGNILADCSNSNAASKPVKARTAARLSSRSTSTSAVPSAAAKPAVSTTAFVSKFALGSVNNQTTYPPVPADLNTFMTLNSQTWESLSLCGIGYDDGLFVDVTIYTNQVGPGLNGDAILTSDTPVGLDDDEQVYAYLPLNSAEIPLGIAAEGIWDGGWTVNYYDYSGWNSSTISGNAPLAPCPPADYARSAHSASSSSAKLSRVPRTRIHPAGALHVAAARFTPPAAGSIHLNLQSHTDSTPACIAPVALKPLTIQIASRSRIYGAENPSFTYAVTGLAKGDTLAVTPSTGATPASPVGSYPITAAISGSNLASYAVQIFPGTLTVKKATLYLSAKNVAVRYGQAPPTPTGYLLTGFLNGDTASVVSGAPTFYSTVTATTPVGFYPIAIQPGTLTAQNYSFSTITNGDGSIQVTKAPLHIHPGSYSIHAGDALPAFGYTLTGFVNGDTQATATTGSATLTTSAPVPTKFGNYYIIGGKGTLQSDNYYFLSYVEDYGFLSVLR
jgi:hypothetical protein